MQVQIPSDTEFTIEHSDLHMAIAAQDLIDAEAPPPGVSQLWDALRFAVDNWAGSCPAKSEEVAAHSRAESPIVVGFDAGIPCF